MKCKYCDAPVTLSDEYCPYCGALNEPARQHILDMKRYGEDYEETRRNVMGNVDRQARSHSRMIAVGILILMNAIMITLQFTFSGVEEMVKTYQINRNYKKHEQVLSDYESRGDYADFYYYYSKQSLYEAKSLRKYSSLDSMCMNYYGFQSALFYATHKDVKTYNDTGYYLERMASSIKYFYDSYKNRDNEYYSKEQFEEPELTAMKDMEDRMITELKVFCNLNEEDISQLSQMEKQDMMLLLGRRLGLYD